MKKPSIILMGSKPASTVALSILLQRGWDVKAVVVARNIDMSWDGGQTLEELATEHGIAVFAQAQLPRDIEVDFVVSYQFRNLVKADVLAMARRAALNFHAAPLPAYGGWAFYNLAILENCELYGCTCHHMDEHFDTGPLVSVRRFPVDIRQQTATSLEARAQQEMLRLFIDVCWYRRNAGPASIHPAGQGGDALSHPPANGMLKHIPADADAETIDRDSRAFWYPPFECASLDHNGVKVELVPAAAKAVLDGPCIATIWTICAPRCWIIGPGPDGR